MACASPAELYELLPRDLVGFLDGVFHTDTPELESLHRLLLEGDPTLPQARLETNSLGAAAVAYTLARRKRGDSAFVSPRK